MLRLLIRSGDVLISYHPARRRSPKAGDDICQTRLSFAGHLRMLESSSGKRRRTRSLSVAASVGSISPARCKCKPSAFSPAQSRSSVPTGRYADPLLIRKMYAQHNPEISNMLASIPRAHRPAGLADRQDGNGAFDPVVCGDPRRQAQTGFGRLGAKALLHIG